VATNAKKILDMSLSFTTRGGGPSKEIEFHKPTCGKSRKLGKEINFSLGVLLNKRKKMSVRHGRGGKTIDRWEREKKGIG